MISTEKIFLSKKHYFKLSVYLLLIVSSLLQFAFSYFGTNPPTINLGPALLLIVVLIPVIAQRDPLEFYGVTLERFKHVSLLRMLLLATVAVVIIDPVGYLVPGFVEFNRTNASAPGFISRQIAQSTSPLIIIPLGFIAISSSTFFEEALFRGLIQKTLLRPKILSRVNPWFAIIVQAILFGAAHASMVMSNPSATKIIVGWIFAIPAIVGLVMGYLSYQNRSILASWYFHWAVNFIGFTLIVLLPSITW